MLTPLKLMIVDLFITIIHQIGDYCIFLISLLLLIDGFGSVIMHFRCNLGMSKTMLKLIANIKEFLNLLSINNPNIIYTSFIFNILHIITRVNVY